MTTDRIVTALIARLSGGLPDPSIAVRDAREVAEVSLPNLAIDVGQPDRHSLAMPGVIKMQLEIILSVHSGDATDRTQLQAWANTIEKLLNGPDEVKSFVNGGAYQVVMHHWLCADGYTDWDETTFRAIWTAECWATRTA